MPSTTPISRVWLVLPLILVCASASLAQSGSAPRGSDWELNIHAAALQPGLFDESSGALQVGGRLFRNFASGVSIGANFDWAAPQDVTLSPFGSSGASLLLYSAELAYRFPVSPRAEFFLGAGYGAARLSLDEAPPGAAASSTGTLIPVGAGFKILNRAISPSWAIRLEGRDNVILLDTGTSDGGVETEPRNNFEASVGFSLLFGSGAGDAVPADLDTDRDGVPDPRDFCLNRPGVPVDARGCPLREEPAPAVETDVPPGAVDVPDAADADPEGEPVPGAPARPDADRDGVPDSEDGCLATPEGVEVAPDGCPILPPPAAEAIPGDEDGDGVGDERDACPGTLPGLPTDERGCLARVRPDAADEPPVVFPEPREEREPPVAEAPVAEAPEAEAAPAGACIDDQRWAAGRGVVEFEGRSFRPAGFPQPVDRQYLRQVGSFEGVPIYVSDTAVSPYTDFWMPRCGDGNVFELFFEGGP
ncbi:MAG TPA: thrombospondin type 3 repeat-containing protein [Gemmatimonadota bacterium]|nr:thrombospondin type 3 repeat-containing protein [Gemmatimonadota bacterium]